jgi:hypothetical protein
MKVPIQDWYNSVTTKDSMIYKGASTEQMMFIRDTLAYALSRGLFYEDRVIPQVISTHRSKSVDLPVAELSRPDLGLTIVVRNNFYNWKLSVETAAPLACDFTGLFITSPPVEPDYTGDHLHPVYFEGFPRERIHGYYDTSDRMKWSAEIGGDYGLMTTIFLIMRALGAVQPHKYTTQVEHRAKLDAEAARRKRADAEEARQ